MLHLLKYIQMQNWHSLVMNLSLMSCLQVEVVLAVVPVMIIQQCVYLRLDMWTVFCIWLTVL